jgi:hypothetical protein
MRKRWVWFTGIALFLLLGGFALDYVADELLHRYMERTLNERLQGYTVRLAGVDFHPVGFSLDLEEGVLWQNANPDPPVARFSRLSASVQWRALLSASIVADFLLERPIIHITRRQTQEEEADEVPVQQRGWQGAVQAIYPLKLNELKVVDGEFTYVEEGQARPLHLSQLQLRAENIRNVWSPDRVYPSELYLTGTVFGSGAVVLDGQANFLAVPHPGVKAQVTLEKIELDYFRPIAGRHRIALRGGTLSGKGNVEYAPRIKVAHLQSLTIHGVQVDYLHTARSAVAEKRAAKEAVQTAQEVSNHPALLLRADEVHIIDATLGFENKAADPDYRLFLADAALHLTNFSNQLAEGTTVGKLTGKFMGSGDTVVNATFRPEIRGPDFDFAVRLEGTQMRAMNALWRAYGNFDVVAGFFSFYTELTVQNREIRGYVKPLFKDLDVYDRRQDEEKGLFRELYEGLVGGIAELLENAPRDEVATHTDVSGEVENPQADTWEVIVRLIQNAFFKAILPGFEKEVGQASR